MKYTRETLLEVMESYLRMIEHDGGKYSAVVLDDIRTSIEFVLREAKNNA